MGKVRLLLKKRGHRWTGSRILGNVGEGAVFVALLLIGSCSLITLGASRLVYIPWFSDQTLSSGVAVTVILILASLIVIGIGGLIWTALRLSTSVERRSALSRKTPQLQPGSEFYPPARDYPTIPRNENLVNSQGVHLAYRLPSRSPLTWSLLAALTFSLMWSALFTVFAVTLVTQFLGGKFLWYLAPVVVVLGIIAWRSTHFLNRRLQEAVQVGPTHVEVSDVPFFPGGHYDVAIIQFGKMTLRKLRVSLVCDEEATFREGTDVRVERRRVVDRDILAEESVRIVPATPLVRWATIHCDDHAMHSFQSVSNAIHWGIHVRGIMADGTDFTREFSIVIFPPPRPRNGNPKWNR